MTAPNYSDEFWMSMALQEAELAACDGEIPVGAVVVKDGQLIAKGRNAPVALADPTAHAEVLALRAAAQILGNYRLEGCTLYVTLEPCVMCSGAIFNGRISRVVFGASEPKTGAAGSVINLFSLSVLNHQTKICGGVLADRCSALLVDFFTKRRQQARAKESQRPVLRDDALRTPDSAFEGFDSYPLHAFAYLSDLPSLSGLRMHYVDQGPSDAPITWLCLHSSLRWSYVFNRLLSELSSSARVVAPDLIGFGRSDKPKKESFHQIERHQQVLLDFVERLQLKRLVLVLDGWDEGVGLLLCAKIASYVEGILVFTDGVECDRSPESMLINDAPFPDSGHRAAPRVFFKIQREIEGKPFLKSSRSYFSNVKKLFCIGSDSDLNFKFFQKNIDFISFDEIDESSFGKFLIKVKNSFISL
jgi:tRNA(adenine34) deaminase